MHRGIGAVARNRLGAAAGHQVADEDAAEVVNGRATQLDIEVVVRCRACPPVDPSDHGNLAVDHEELDVVDHPRPHRVVDHVDARGAQPLRGRRRGGLRRVGDHRDGDPALVGGDQGRGQVGATELVDLDLD